MITEHTLKQNNESITVQIVRSKRRTLGLQVKGSGEVIARVPERLPDREIVRFLTQHENWIFRKAASQKHRADKRTGTGAKPYSDLTAAERRQIQKKFEEKAEATGGAYTYLLTYEVGIAAEYAVRSAGNVHARVNRMIHQYIITAKY